MNSFLTCQNTGNMTNSLIKEIGVNMKFENIISQESSSCDKFIIRSCTMVSGFILFTWFLNVINLFIVDSDKMAICCSSAVIILSVPPVIYFFKVKGHLTHLNFKYASLIFVLIGVWIMYSFLTFHAIFFFLFPSIVFNIYGDKKLTKWTMTGTIIIMFLSHVTGMYMGVCPQEPFTEPYTVFIYGLLPKLITYFAFMYVFIFETDHNNGMLRKIYSYACDMHQTQEELVRAFAQMCESKSGQTGYHVKRVAEYVEIMAKYLDIQTVERECLVTASMMHDIGKLNIPEEILDKPGKLTPDEYEIIKKRTHYGYELLKNSPGRTMEIASDIALNHHERWDGKGYNGFAGQNISLYSRIMAIADVFDALVSKRSYKDKWLPEDAYNEIVSQSGKQFDPYLVDVFIECYSKFLDIIKTYSDDPPNIKSKLSDFMSKS